ncbi:MAG: hypothetical protein EPO37_07755 [Nitrosarchaeum sp.]|nr:MAG: hypothetical protein EPO37_07755 [Nitrosarchaeum sp.]
MFVIPINAQTPAEFGYQLHPEKLLENTVGTLQIFVTSNEMMVPRSINDLRVISSDNSVIQIINIQENNSGYAKNVQIKAIKPGIANIALAAPGFSSKEITLEVFNNNNHPTQILMKVTPDDFPIDGPRFGYVTVELATTGGLPTIAPEDITVYIETPNKDTISLKNQELLIKKGEYFATTEFNLVNSGDAIIFASAENMKKISEFVHIRKPTEPLQVQLFVIPEQYSSYSGATGYAIVELLDGEGAPVKAEEDIHMKLGVENPDVSVNTSNDFEEIQFSNKELIIKKGEYSAYTTFTPRPNLGDITTDSEQTFNMFISTDNYLTNGDSFTISHDEMGALEGEGPSITTVLPFLTTGEKEIIAVTYFETNIEISRQTGSSILGTTDRELVTVTVPVTAKQDYEINFASSESDTVKPINPIMKKGENVALVFGNTGTIAPDDSVAFYITDNEGVKTVTGTPIGPIKEDIDLTAEPLVPMILAGSEFPVIAYLLESEEDEEVSTTTDEDAEDENGRIGITPFIEDSVLTLSANDFVEAEPEIIKQNQPYVLLNLLTKEVGDTKLSFQAGQFEGNMAMTSHTTDPAEMHLSFVKNLLANTESLATIQILDSVGNPVYAKEEILIKVVSNDESVLKIPDEVIIKKGEYFNTFKLESQNEGKIELALLSEDLPLSKYDINIVDVSPVISLDLLGGLNWNERVEAKLSVTIPEIETSLDGFNVEWTADGGEVLQMDDVTNSDGIAIMNILANDKDTITVSATVSGNGLSSSTISKTAQILNMPIAETPVEEGFTINNSNMIYIIIPVAIGAALFILKRTERLDTITEKLGMGEKFEEIKEKISGIRNR